MRSERSVEEILDAVRTAASETAPDWETRCGRIMSALGLDFGQDGLEMDMAVRSEALRALRLAEHDQIDLLHVCRGYIKETDDPGKIRMRTMRADAVEQRLKDTRAAIRRVMVE
ncbi:hypothetical protein [Paracoccus litorisediminis]|uniref:Uncharacterized protein n=1 Tax=Paracoccus litorisediminis TaxID=2006130 RepID=A0A844HSE2_9RHOB|nr:hypothetical protein [Paracoccus litorisediminis]MTH61125.1 hypothetical protein [Paracoccus litorisediminis]